MVLNNTGCLVEETPNDAHCEVVVSKHLPVLTEDDLHKLLSESSLEALAIAEVDGHAVHHTLLHEQREGVPLVG